MRFLKKVKNYIRISKVGGISRRYFVMNAFDGAMTVLGIVIAAFLAGTQDPSIIISAGIGVSVAMGISGFSGAYITEKAEKEIELNKIEKYMLKKLDNTMIGRANRFASIWAALVDGLSPALAALICLIPFFLSRAGMVGIDLAMKTSMGLAFLIIFLLGVYMGKLAKKNALFHGLKILLAGFAVAAILFIVQFMI